MLTAYLYASLNLTFFIFLGSLFETLPQDAYHKASWRKLESKNFPLFVYWIRLLAYSLFEAAFNSGIKHLVLLDSDFIFTV